MDTDGSIHGSGAAMSFTNISKDIIDGLAGIIRSLGGTVGITIYTNREGNRKDLYKLNIRTPFNPFSLERKSCKWIPMTNAMTKIRLVEIRDIPMEPSVCIAIDNESHQYLVDNYVRTHNTGLKGTRQGLQRPQFAIMDDMVKSDAEANSPVILENIHNTVYSDVLNALHGAKSFAVMIGTPYNKNDPVYKAIETGAWVPVVFPICKKISSDLKKPDFKGVWEDRHSYEAVMRRWKKAVKGNTTNAFMKELMLRISNEEDRMIKDDWLEWFDRSNVIRNAHKYNWYFTSDYTTTGGEDSDFSGAAVWAVNSDGDFMLIDLILAKMDLAFQYEETFRLMNTYKKKAGYIPAGIETDGQQKVHIFALKQMMQKRGEYFTIAMQKGTSHLGIKSGGVKKIDRFRPMVPMFQHHKIWFANELKGTPQMDELLEELKYLTHESSNSKHDDGLDLISQMNLMPVVVPADDGSGVNTIDSVGEFERHNVYTKYKSDIYNDIDEDKSSYIF